MKLVSKLNLLLLLGTMSGLAQAGDVQPFRFIQMSDLHLQTSETTMSRNLKKAYEDIEKNFPDAAFVITCGDLTECGYKSEFDHYIRLKQGFTKPIYDTMGNHDSVWSENGKENYRDKLGENYRTVDHNGVRFVIMDTSVLLEHYGHFEGTQMARLRRDMASRAPGQPLVVSYHHPLGGNFVDNEFEFIDTIRNRNVPLVLTGHGHVLSVNRTNGTTYAMGGSTFGACAYRVWTVDGNTATAFTRKFLDGVSGEVDTTVPLSAPSVPENMLTDLTQTSGTGAVRFALTRCDVTSESEVSCTIDGAFESKATRDASGMWQTPPRDLPPGIHRLAVKFTDAHGDVLSEMTTFTSVLTDTASPRLHTKSLPLASGSQSPPAVDGDSLYVGCNDGKLYCFDLRTNKEKWTANLEREILGSPVVRDGKIYIGSFGKNVYCLNAADGRTLWKTSVGGAVLSSVLVTDRCVLTGGGDGGMHALDRATGKEIWRWQSKQFVQMPPTLADGGKSVVFGGWDNQIVKLDIDTGRQIWSVPSARAAILGCATARVAVDGDMAVCNSHDKKVKGIRVSDGETVWTWNPPNPTYGPSFSSPVIDNGVAYTGSIDGILYGYDVRTGRVVTQVPLRPGRNDAVFDSSPRIADGKAYIGTVGGNLYCVDLAAKKVDWSVALQPGFIFTTPAVHRGKVYVSSMNNCVYIIDTQGAGNK